MTTEQIRNKSRGNWKKFFSKPIPSSIIGSLVIYGLLFISGYFDVREDIKYNRSSIDSLVVQNKVHIKKIKDITDNYAMKEDGIQIEVGVSTELEQNSVSVYKDNTLGLKFSDAVILTNSIHMYKPTIKLVVGFEREKSNNVSQAEIFISEEAANMLGFKNYKKVGLFKVNCRKILKEN